MRWNRPRGAKSKAHNYSTGHRTQHNRTRKEGSGDVQDDVTPEGLPMTNGAWQNEIDRTGQDLSEQVKR